MYARDVMTTRVVSVLPENSVKRAAQIMLDQNVSGLPVVDGDGRLVGMITEGDLLRRAEFYRMKSLASADATASGDKADAFVKAYSWKVADVMTPDVISIDESVPVSRIAALMDEHMIKRVPVTREGRLVGIVSRRDLLRVIATTKLDTTAKGDAAIRRSILARLDEDAGLDTARLGVTVNDGVVHLWGTVRSETQRTAARVVAECTSGVSAVIDHLSVVQA